MRFIQPEQAMIEQFFSSITTVYHFKRMNTMTIRNVDRLLGLYFTMVVMQALSSYKLNRVDLMMSPTAFIDIDWVNIYSNHEMNEYS